ncbi:hypothetical protein FZO89_02710 [Luteimonas viscosa]|uniref:Uncharacterized protein n=1 Tax=Luteimonas viscosa TaxID=1132694 RepID=A0A5D4XMS9_9GAMM|nr:hypothetical protein [Luteimonas viscosa]TYT25265.1 hypothetical protein FZO89_02710 [Luteimonas viscosa]
MNRCTRWRCALLAAILPVSAAGTDQVPAETEQALRRVAAIADDPASIQRATALWNVALDAPVVLIDPATRASWRMDAATGKPVPAALRADQLPANTCIEVDGVPTVMLMLPLSDDGDALSRLLWHERWHCVQRALGLPAVEGENAHLDEEQGRTWLRLELRALAQALAAAKGDGNAQGHARAALAFRARRSEQGELATGALLQEARLERNEGLAEYTGRVVASAAGDPVPALLDALRRADDNDGFVRSMAYATGPAYGLLLDRWRDGWRSGVNAGTDLPTLLSEVLGAAAVDAERAGQQYGIDDVRMSERDRAALRAQRAATYRDRFVEGATLRLPLRNPSMSFDPRTLFPLGDAGTVYGTLTARETWGELIAKEGALVAPDWSAITVGAQDLDGCGGSWTGPGWSLALSAGWRLQRDDGKWRVVEGQPEACED